jgi:hypothetical protein
MLTVGDHAGFRARICAFLPQAASLPGPGPPDPQAGHCGTRGAIEQTAGKLAAAKQNALSVRQ